MRNGKKLSKLDKYYLQNHRLNVILKLVTFKVSFFRNFEIGNKTPVPAGPLTDPASLRKFRDIH